MEFIRTCLRPPGSDADLQRDGINPKASAHPKGGKLGAAGRVIPSWPGAPAVFISPDPGMGCIIQGGGCVLWGGDGACAPQSATMIPAAHLHLLLNHLPVVGSLFALGLLAWGFWRQGEALQRAGLGAAIIVALATIPTYLTGEPAWEDIMSLPGDNDPFIEAHEFAAQFAFGVSALTGIVALLALVVGRGGKPLPVRLTRLVLLLLLATTGLMGCVANLGGRIRHTEIRAGGIEGAAKE